jgi:hypothetical protein
LKDDWLLKKWSSGWAIWQYESRSLEIPVVPHKAVAEVSKIGNL